MQIKTHVKIRYYNLQFKLMLTLLESEYSARSGKTYKET